MRKIILLVHLSLDGFVAGPQGDLRYFEQSDDNLAFVNSLTENADGALFGRSSYKLLNDFWPAKRDDPQATLAETAFSNWYNAVQKIVVSGTLADAGNGKLMVIRRDTESALHKLRQSPGKNILIFGSPTLSQALMAAVLIDEFWVIIHPVFFGNGLPLFTGAQPRAGLALAETHVLAKGHIAAHYLPA